MIDFATTACNRPGLLDRTYASFSENLRGLDLSGCTLYLNVDPMPDGEGRGECVRVARKHFGRVVSRLPDEASFSEAARWCWSNVDTDFFFNLEDDWCLTRAVHVDELLRVWEMPGAAGALQVILRHSPGHGPAPRDEKPEYEQITSPGLPPSLIRRASLGDMVREFDVEQNPEKYLRSWHKGLPKDERPPVYMWPSEPISIDAGREWRKVRGIIKKATGIPYQWTTWTKK